MIVNIIKDYDFPDLFRQSPNVKGIWEGVTFVNDCKTEYDLLICLNFPKKDIYTNVPRENRWLFTQEPPIESNLLDKATFNTFGKVFTQHTGENCISTQTALPWHINRNFDELVKLPSPVPKYNISSVTSGLYSLDGHKKRIDFLEYLENSNIRIHRYGKNINYIKNKEDGLLPYKYSICIENSFYPDYWTEKISDCFLSYTMPIYDGCNNIGDYFPVDSMISIDLNDFEKSKSIILNAIHDDKWQINFNAIMEARNLVLFKYQFFPWVKSLMTKHYDKDIKKLQGHEIIPSVYNDKVSVKEKAKSYAKKIKGLIHHHLHP